VNTEETTLLTSSLREVFAGPAAEVPARLRELGWDDVVAEDPATATTLLFGQKGRALSGGTLLDDLVLTALALPESADVVCYPYPGHGSAPSSGPDQLSGILLAAPVDGARVVVPVSTADGTRLAVAPAADLEITPLSSLDAEAGWLRVAGDVPAELHDGAAWDGAVPLAHRALAAEIVGVAARALELAVEHTSTRLQFNAPIAAFQAVRHRLADGHVALAAARALLEASFVDGAAVSAKAAKARAGVASALVSANAVQVSGAMGSTLEHPLHRYVNRAAVLDALLGSASELTLELGALIRATVDGGGELPLLVEV